MNKPLETRRACTHCVDHAKIMARSNNRGGSSRFTSNRSASPMTFMSNTAFNWNMALVARRSASMGNVSDSSKHNTSTMTSTGVMAGVCMGVVNI